MENVGEVKPNRLLIVIIQGIGMNDGIGRERYFKKIWHFVLGIFGYLKFYHI